MLHDVLMGSHNIVGHMQWELHASALLGMSVSEIRFALSFFLYVVAACGLRLFKNATVRHVYSLLTGVVVVYYPFGSAVLHAVPPAVLTYLTMWIVPRKCGTLTWIICFPYLLCLHAMNASGVNWNEGELDFTGGAMVLVLKLIATAVSYQDHFDDEKKGRSRLELARLPGLLEYWSFVFAYGNLLAGPSLEFKDYQEFIEGKGEFEGERRTPRALRAAQTVASACLWSGAYVALEPYAPIRLLTSHAFEQANVAQRLGMQCAVLITYRFRYYFAWQMTEAALTASGLNYNGVDGDGRPQWDRYQNVLPLRVEFQEYSRKLASNWNRCTGAWLRRYVYERLTPKNGKPTSMTLVLTMTTSAVWHGLYPGYLMYFLNLALFFEYSTVVYKATRLLHPSIGQSLPARVLRMALTNLFLNSTSTVFVVLHWQPSIHQWAAVWFVPHAVMVATLAAWLLLGPRTQRAPQPVSAAVVDALGAPNGAAAPVPVPAERTKRE